MTGAEMYASASTGEAVFSWVVSDVDEQVIGMLLRVTPDRHEHAVADMGQLIKMLEQVGLEPQFRSQIVRARKNPPPSVTVSWTGAVNDLDKAQELLSKMTEIWRR
jgi:hypothetical protein